MGQMLKQFRLDTLLGEGGMGLVYRAYDTRLHRAVAVKFLSVEVTCDPQRRQRFLQEARAAARINHPSVAQIFDADEQDGLAFIVMELVEGKTVQQLIQDRELDFLGAMEIGVQVAEGLAKAHDLGIIHRDIKPANVMRTADGHVKILDFGLAKLQEVVTPGTDAATLLAGTSQLARTQTGLVMGTPAYMSPEQVRGLPVDARADVFALGVMLFEMVTNQSPFRRDSFVDALHAAAFEEAPPMRAIRPHVPEAFERVVSRCLRKQPDERYADARSLVVDLELIRRSTEAGLTPKLSWRQRFSDACSELRSVSPSRFVWYGVGAVLLVGALYWSVSHISTGTMISFALIAVFVYRHFRNQPQRLYEQFVRRTSKVPEVRIITSHEHQFTVVVDRPVAQLYSRLQRQLRICNKKRYYGPPMTLSILYEVPSEQTRQILVSPGVEYVREDVVEPPRAISPGGRS